MTSPARKGASRERGILSMVNIQRYPNDGRAKADGANEWLVVEVFTANHTKKMLSELQQAVDEAAGKKLPVAVMHQKGKRYEDALVYMRWGDFVDWFGGE